MKNFERNIDYQDTELYTTLIVPFDREYIETKYGKRTKRDFSIRSNSTRINRSAQT